MGFLIIDPSNPQHFKYSKYFEIYGVSSLAIGDADPWHQVGA